MLGVVLWSDNLDKKAVIWCEDQGDLAYFNGDTDTPFDYVDLDAGDLVQFELQQERHLRFAHNPRRIEQGAYADLPNALQEATAPKQQHEIPVRTQPQHASAKVIPFASLKRRARSADLVLA